MSDLKEVYKSSVHNISFYIPANNNYHLSRHMAASAQNIYSASGITKDLLSKYIDAMIGMCNEEKNVKTLRTDIGTLCNNLKYRLSYPIDEDCALRMGAIYCLLEDEAPDTINPELTEKKILLAKGDYNKGMKPDPDLYAFFLITGIVYTPAWKEYEKLTQDTEYFKKREETLRMMLPLSLSNQK